MSSRRVDSPALIFGVVFVVIAGWWLLDRLVDWHLAYAGWIVAGALILLGAAGIARAFRSPRE
jgi:type IV secretory pathway VirB2 component (pilin)